MSKETKTPTPEAEAPKRLLGELDALEAHAADNPLLKKVVDAGKDLETFAEEQAKTRKDAQEVVAELEALSSAKTSEELVEAAGNLSTEAKAALSNAHVNISELPTEAEEIAKLGTKVGSAKTLVSDAAKIAERQAALEGEALLETYNGARAAATLPASEVTFDKVTAKIGEETKALLGDAPKTVSDGRKWSAKFLLKGEEKLNEAGAKIEGRAVRSFGEAREAKVLGKAISPLKIGAGAAILLGASLLMNGNNKNKYPEFESGAQRA